MIQSNKFASGDQLVKKRKLNSHILGAKSGYPTGIHTGAQLLKQSQYKASRMKRTGELTQIQERTEEQAAAAAGGAAA